MNPEALKVKRCPCCKQPVNSRDYGKEMFNAKTTL